MFTKNSNQEDSGATGKSRGRPRGRTEQGNRTRRHLYRIATRMIARRGYGDTTLRDIATKAGVSPGLLYKYFPGKRAVVLAVFDELSHQYATEAKALPPGKWRVRFLFALKTSLSVLGQERNTLSALIPILVSTGSEGLFAPATEFSRMRVQAVFSETVLGATDCLQLKDAEALGRVLYFTHLGVILWWLLDKSSGQSATKGLLKMLERALPLVAIALKIRSVRVLLRQANELLSDAFLGDISGMSLSTSSVR